MDLDRGLPAAGLEALSDPDQHRIDLAHAAGDAEYDREEAGQSAHRHLRSWSHPEPHDHDREEDDLRRRPEIIEIVLEGLGQEATAAECKADHQPEGAAN